VSYVLAFPILFLTMMLQMVVINKLPLLYGYADLILLVVTIYAMHARAKNAWFWALLAGLFYGFVSKIPVIVPIIVFGVIIVSARYIRSRIWQMPILAYIFLVIAGTLLFQFLSLISLKFTGSVIPIMESINVIVIPSVMLNLIFAIPVYYIFNDFLDVVNVENTNP
jgi:cell shape-determining protein MreD